MTAPFQLFDALPAHIEDALRASIERFGVLVPITVDQDGVVLDGHHRKRIAEELRVPYDRLVRHCADDGERGDIAHTLNADRRQLSGDELRQAVVHLAQWRDQHGVGLSNVQIADALHVDETTIRRELDRATSAGAEVDRPDRVRGKDGKDRPSRRPQVIARDDREQNRAQAALGIVPDVTSLRTLDVKRIERIARDTATELARAAADAAPLVTADVRMEHCSLADLSLEPDSVDLMFTDPPYPAEYVPLWSDLGSLAAKALKPGGLLVAYSGQMFLPDAMHRLSEHLDYWWMYSITHVGAFFQLRARHTQVGWKPLLVYRKSGGDLPPWVNDIVTDGVREKSGHDWQQSEAEAAYWIERLTEPGGLVVDPFLGSGTTASVCRGLGRRFVGCDVDPLAVARSKERVA